ncbi:MAG: HD domain-containing protein [Butyrivibrio sp.]|nr:HD domain-containing protein [Butyrivibrio sp.]
MSTTIIENAKSYIEEIFRNNADGHDAEHSKRVYSNAMKLADRYPECDSEVVALASLLHDVDDHKLFDTKDNANARAFLTSNNIEEKEIEWICAIIKGVSFSKNRGKKPESLEGQIVQDADRLDAIGAVGIARTFAYGGKVGRSLDDSVQHFYDKLLLLKDEMNTEEAKKMALQRHEYIEGFIEEFKKEIAALND